MTTAEAIEAITDAGQFERLATQVLRHLDQDSRLIEHAGVNAQGKTIANPVDGFHRVSHSGSPRFVIHQFATTARDKLERKWLNRPKTEGDEVGDLSKASRLAKELRKQFPTAHFIIWLCTNQRLDPEFMARVYVAAEQEAVEVRLLGQSTLGDWLDQNPEGHWLRRQFLGITAERLSRPLLAELAAENLRNYAGEFPLVAPADFVRTRAADELFEHIENGAARLLLLLGRSGCGKSSACYQLLEHSEKKHQIALWLSAEIVEQAHTFAEAIGILLRGLAREIEPAAGEIALQFFSIDQPLVVVVDDINRAQQPAKLLQKIMNWVRPRPEEARGSRWQIVCPMWEEHIASSRNRLAGVEWIVELSLSSLTLAEAETCLRTALGAASARLTPSQGREIAEKLGRDPILLSMYGRRFASSSDPRTTGINDIIGGYVADACAEAASQSNLLPNDFARALDELARWMLARRQYYPQWDLLTNPTSGLAIFVPPLRALIHQGKLCRVANRAGESRFEFRHDRLLSHHLATVLGDYLEEPERHEGILSEPFFVEHIGAGFARKAFLPSALAWLKTHAPVTLFAAVGEFDGENRSRELAVAEQARQWLRQALREGRAFWPQAYAALRLLERAETSDVLAITADVADEFGVELPRILHGDVMTAIRWLIRRHHVFPSHRHPRLESCVDRARERHGPAMAQALRAALVDTNITGKPLLGALSLTALLGDRSCAPEVLTSARPEAGNIDLLTWGFWAALRCGADNPSRFLDPFLRAWRNLSTESKPHHTSPRQNFGSTFSRMDWSSIAPSVIEYLVGFGRANSDMRSEFLWLLHEVDDPSAIVFVNEGLAELAAKSNRGWHHWEMSFRDVWDPAHSRGRRMSAPSRAALRRIWEAAGGDAASIRSAMRTWVRATHDLAELRQVPHSHPDYSSAQWRRALLGDRTIIQEVVEAARRTPHWIKITPHIWSPLFEPVVEDMLVGLRAVTPADFSGGHSNGHYDLSQVLRDIPKVVAEPILLRHWGHMRYSPLFVQLAIYLGGPTLLPLAAEVVADCPAPESLFEHCGSMFGFRTFGLQERIDLDLLQRIAPYARHMNNMDLGDLIHSALRLGEHEWVEREFRGECERREREQKDDELGKGRDVRRERFPSDDELLAELDAMLAKTERSFELQYWFERLEDRVGGRERGWVACQQWFTQSRTAAKWTFVADAVARLGTRTQLTVFHQWRPDDAGPALLQIEAGVEFEVRRRSPV